MNQQDALASKLSPMEAILAPAGPRTVEQAALLRAFQRIESQIARLEAQILQSESHFYLHALRNAGKHTDLLKLLFDIAARLGDLETRLGLHKPSDPEQRP